MEKPFLFKWNKNKIKRFWNIYQADERYNLALIWSEAFSDFFLFGISNIIKNWKKDAKILDVGCGNGALLKN